MFETSKIELSQNALQNNIKFIRKHLRKGVRFCSVVKGNAYGHGLSEFVKMALNEGVDYFAVYSADEAYYLKQKVKSGYDLFIMGAVDGDAVDWAVKNNIEISVFNFERLNKVLAAAKKNNIKAKIHIELETGMRRTGFDFTEIPQLCKFLKKNDEFISFHGLFTHFAGAESQSNYFRIMGQINQYDVSLKLFESSGQSPVYKHAACSAAMLNFPETQGNMVRIGILQYGFWPNIETHIKYCGEKNNNPDPLRRIIKWTSSVMAVSESSKGSFVGYGTSYLAHKNMKLAVIPVGYSYGYGRNLSNVGSVLIHGKLCPVVGIVNMNCLTADITNINDINLGDEVVLIGKQENKSISVNSFSEQSHQLNYELLTRLPYNIPRIVTD